VAGNDFDSTYSDCLFYYRVDLAEQEYNTIHCKLIALPLLKPISRVTFLSIQYRKNILFSCLRDFQRILDLSLVIVIS